MVQFPLGSTLRVAHLPALFRVQVRRVVDEAPLLEVAVDLKTLREQRRQAAEAQVAADEAQELSRELQEVSAAAEACGCPALLERRGSAMNRDTR